MILLSRGAKAISKKFIKIAVIVLVCICLFDVVLSGVVSVPKEFSSNEIQMIITTPPKNKVKSHSILIYIKKYVIKHIFGFFVNCTCQKNG